MNNKLSVTEIHEFIRGLDMKFLFEAQSDWDLLLSNSSYCPVDYMGSFVKYQAAYVAAFSEDFYDLSVVIYHDNRPTAVLPLFLKHNENQWLLCSCSNNILKPPLFRDGVPEKSRKTIIRTCLYMLNYLCNRTNQTSWKGEEIVGIDGVSLWHRFVMETGAKAEVYHELYTDLSPELGQIRSQFRKSYKPLITLGSRLWRSQVLTGVDDALFDEFRLLHHNVAGRITRPKETWDLQQKCINNGEAFLVTLRDAADVLVGGGLFHTSPHEGVYAIGVYDRSLFDKPLGHVVQMRAIGHMKELGLRWYRLGNRPYEGDCVMSTEKEMQIAKFKEGFSTHSFIKIRTLFQVPPDAVI